ncbi:hypothetical protein LCGC14_2312010 [marine sediment metagenome]|uniref:Polymerase nucleotidyl transferase domain-containing protein n=1 Tax=marine sediment metagenome TaxID=412755 RepID=A0A0F9CKG7_9ZZZZ
MKSLSSPLITGIIADLKKKLGVNLIAIYGIGSCFDDSLPENFMKNDIDLIAIVRSTKSLGKFSIKEIGKKHIFIGYNTIESYNNKKIFDEISGANYEWSLICIKHPENSKLLYGTDIRNQIPETTNIQFDYDNILIRGFYHLEKSFKNGLRDIAKLEYSKTLFKFGFYFCVLHDKTFRHVSLTEIRKKLKKLYKSGAIDSQIFEYFETAFNYRCRGEYDSDFHLLRLKTRYYFISLLSKRKTHRLMDYTEIKTFFSSYFGGLPILKVFVRNLELKKH